MNRFSISGLSLGGLLTVLACISLFSPMAAAAGRIEIKRMVINEAALSNVPIPLALAVAKVESDFNAQALSSAGARGVMQIMPATGRKEFGLTADQLWNPRTNIRTGIQFLEQLHHQYGQRWDLALSHYNGGTLKGRGRHARAHGYTQKYVSTVFRWRDVYSEQARLWGQQGDGRSPTRTARIKPLSDDGDLQSTINRLRAEVQRREDDYYDQRPGQRTQSLFREYHDGDESETGEDDFSNEPLTRTAMIHEEQNIFVQRWHAQRAKILRRPLFRHTDPAFQPQKLRRRHPVFRRHPGRRFQWN